MKAIMISIRPGHVRDIVNLIKKIEVRRNKPSCDLPIDVFIYCAKDVKRNLQKVLSVGRMEYFYCLEREKRSSLNGKVVAKFTLNKVEEIEYRDTLGYPRTKTLDSYDLTKASCVDNCDIKKYLKSKNGYAWHIDNLVIFDKPRELNEFMKVSCKGCPFENTQTCHNDTTGKYCRLNRAPQSWCYVEVEKHEIH